MPDLFLPDSQHLHQWSRAEQNYPITSLHNSSSHSLCAGYQGDSLGSGATVWYIFFLIFIIYFISLPSRLASWERYYQLKHLLCSLSCELMKHLAGAERFLRMWKSGRVIPTALTFPVSVILQHLAGRAQATSCQESASSSDGKSYISGRARTSRRLLWIMALIQAGQSERVWPVHV